MKSSLQGGKAIQGAFDFSTVSDALSISFPNTTMASPKDPKYLSVVVL